tara:strand:+ start:197 stop:376 length:180 start_codon:yes stop_codon:yes gene_type:complete
LALFAVEKNSHGQKTRILPVFRRKSQPISLAFILEFIEAAAVPLGFSTKKTPLLGGVTG